MSSAPNTSNKSGPQIPTIPTISSNPQSKLNLILKSPIESLNQPTDKKNTIPMPINAEEEEKKQNAAPPTPPPVNIPKIPSNVIPSKNNQLGPPSAKFRTFVQREVLPARKAFGQFSKIPAVDIKKPIKRVDNTELLKILETLIDQMMELVDFNKILPNYVIFEEELRKISDKGYNKAGKFLEFLHHTLKCNLCGEMPLIELKCKHLLCQGCCYNNLRPVPSKNDPDNITLACPICETILTDKELASIFSGDARQ